MMNYSRYERIPEVKLNNRKWPGNVISKAPIWCSVDLRDGNQALEIPMNMEQKLMFFKLLCDLGFKEIEIGFPAASETDYNFCRELIDNDLIPADVYIQVLTQSRPHIIEKTMEAISGAKNVIIHLYNSTSKLQRDVVFEFGEEDCIKLATDGARLITDILEGMEDMNVVLEYSPESFSSTEPEFALRICNEVLDVWNKAISNKIIINLPETVEYTTPNVYADMVEYMSTNINYRDNVLISIHTHNDRGTAIAAAELGLMAGADRVEGTLFGNGERTGNSDLVTMAINLMMQGIDPVLDFSNISKVIEIYEECTRMRIDPRHPWAGKLVFTAFSGSHQDAINKGRTKMSENNSSVWEVPYLPIDPHDIGRDYEPIIRINAQSGRGGLSYVLEEYYGIIPPKNFLKDFLTIIKKETDSNETELLPSKVFELFDDNYINVVSPISLTMFSEFHQADKKSMIEASINDLGKPVKIIGEGSGILEAFVNALTRYTGVEFSIESYSEHSMKSGSDSAAISYIEIKRKSDSHKFIGAGVSTSVIKSSIRAIISAYNRMIGLM